MGPAHKINNRKRGRPELDAREEVREKLLDAAAWLFSEQGIAATTVAQVAKRAGVTSAMVHYYFKNREHLTEAMFHERVLLFRDLVWQKEFLMQGSDVIDGLTLLVQRILAATEQLPWLPNLWVREVLNEHGLLRERLLKHFPREQFIRLGSRLAEEQQLGKVNAKLDPTLTIVSVFGLTMVMLATRNLWHQLAPVKSGNNNQLAEHILSLLIDGLSGKSQRRKL